MNARRDPGRRVALRRLTRIAWGRTALVVVPLLAGLTLLAPARLAAQETQCDPGDVEVRKLEFTGNRAFSDADLANAVVTTASNWQRRWFRVIGTRRCLDRTELPRDVLRLVLLYRNHGYFDVQVDTVLRALSDAAAEVRFDIHEGAPTRVDSVTITGLSGLRDSAWLARGLPLRAGRLFDRGQVEATRDTLLRRLRDRGYPRAEVLRSYARDQDSQRARVRYDVVPGAFARFGTVRVDIEPRDSAKGAQLSERTVRRSAGIRRGQAFSESALEAAKRSLYQSDAYTHVDVNAYADTGAAASDSLVNVELHVVENYMHTTRVGGGWGTLDCFRAQGSFTDRDFANGHGRLELTGRLSKIGIGRPLGSTSGRFGRALCTESVREDPYSDTLNYYVGATLRQPVVFGLRAVPSLTLFSERRSEYKAYLRTTPIGGIASYDFPRRRNFPAMTLAYQLELGRTNAEPALFCAVFNLCTETDRDQVQKLRRLATVSGALVRDRTDGAAEPVRGTVTRLELRHASRLVGSDPTLQFNRATGDVSWYHKGGGNTLAARIRVGTVFGNTLRLTDTTRFFIPPQERLYAGGPNSVRGFRQNELGPAVYVVSRVAKPDTIQVIDASTAIVRLRPDSGSAVRVVPTGGNSVVVGTVEYRIRSAVLPELLQWAVFTDFGQVWNRGDVKGFRASQLKVTPGVGIRFFSPVGALRMDIGYNPYLRPPGAAYYDLPIASTGAGANAPLLCVSSSDPNSPNETPPITVVNGVPVSQDLPGGSCPGGYSPGTSKKFFQRLTFNFSIGQAF